MIVLRHPQSGQIAYRVQHGNEAGTDEHEAEHIAQCVAVVDGTEKHDRHGGCKAHALARGENVDLTEAQQEIRARTAADR